MSDGGCDSGGGGGDTSCGAGDSSCAAGDTSCGPVNDSSCDTGPIGSAIDMTTMNSTHHDSLFSTGHLFSDTGNSMLNNDDVTSFPGRKNPHDQPKTCRWGLLVLLVPLIFFGLFFWFMTKFG